MASWQQSSSEETTPLTSSDSFADNHHEQQQQQQQQQAPISGAIPPFTSTTHRTEDTLRHRHANAHDAPHHHRTPPYQLGSMSLDDADMAAGSTLSSFSSEPRHRSATQPSAVTPRSGSLTRGGPSLLPRPNSDNVRIRKRLSGRRALSDDHSYHHSRRDDSLKSHPIAMLSPPSLQSMDRGLQAAFLGGSEHDFLSLRASGVESESSLSSNEENIYRSFANRSSVTAHPPYRLPTIDGSPLVSSHIFHKEHQLPIPPLHTHRFTVLGYNLSNHTRRSQFLISAGGTFVFSLAYGYLQELISVELCHRKLGLFLASMQFLVYAVLSYFFRSLDDGNAVVVDDAYPPSNKAATTTTKTTTTTAVPMKLYLGLSILRAIDLGMTNLAMQYVNYPAKTLMKSTRIVFTMLFGVIVTKKRYNIKDYAIVGLMVAGLGIFMHADSKSSAVFQPAGVMMLTISLLCDGAISNVSESIMNRYEVGQDEFIFRLYSVALFFVSIAALFKGDLRDGSVYLTRPGTWKEIDEDSDPTWSISAKFVTLILFSTTGYLSSSCSAAITKSFGALTMSITSTARKAATIFLSFALFPNECTLEHISGIVLFIGSLIGKSMRASRHNKSHHGHHYHKKEHSLEIGGLSGGGGSSNRTVAGIMKRKNVEDAV